MISNKQLDAAIKHDSGKPRWDLIPPIPLEMVADVYRRGADKYAPRNHEAGLRWGRVFRALISHAWKWWRGETHDTEDGQHHLASVVWCALTLMEYEIRGAGEDDRVPYPAHIAHRRDLDPPPSRDPRQLELVLFPR